jgi:DNA-binding response OmpR family regulator
MTRGKIVVVDDDPAVREVMHDHLVSIGYDVSVAEDGHAALRLLNTVVPDLILLDVAMPGIDGVEVLRRVTAKWPHVPVVMITAFNDSKTAARALEESAADYVSKPFELKHLERVVAAQMKRSPSRAVLLPDPKDIWVE